MSSKCKSELIDTGTYLCTWHSWFCQVFRSLKDETWYEKAIFIKNKYCSYKFQLIIVLSPTRKGMWNCVCIQVRFLWPTYCDKKVHLRSYSFLIYFLALEHDLNKNKMFWSLDFLQKSLISTMCGLHSQSTFVTLQRIKARHYRHCFLLHWARYHHFSSPYIRQTLEIYFDLYSEDFYFYLSCLWKLER